MPTKLDTFPKSRRNGKALCPRWSCRSLVVWLDGSVWQFNAGERWILLRGRTWASAYQNLAIAAAIAGKAFHCTINKADDTMTIQAVPMES